MREKVEKGEFQIKSYGKGELAAMYCPEITAKGAYKIVRKWINNMPGLPEKLEALGLSAGDKRYTPAQVSAIVEAIGMPHEWD